MKHGLMHTFGLVATALLTLGAGPAGAATTAAGPYYANPSWDQQLPASTRFVVLSNWVDAAHPSGGAAVLDRETGLVWEQSPSTPTFTWEDAEFHCIDLNAGGRTGWRLPTIQELLSLVDRSVSFPGPTLPPGHPFSVQSVPYWSATTLAADASVAWGVVFSRGFVLNDIAKRSVVFAWCVRGGQGVDPQ